MRKKINKVHIVMSKHQDDGKIYFIGKTAKDAEKFIEEYPYVTGDLFADEYDVEHYKKKQNPVIYYGIDKNDEAFTMD